MNIIDPHLHFFDLLKGQYSWLKESPPNWPNIEKIRQNHLPEHLFDDPEIKLHGCIHVEAGFDNERPIRELNWLNEVLSNLSYKAVAYTPIDASHIDFRSKLDDLSHPSLIAIRDITEGSDAKRLLAESVIDNIQLLTQRGVHFEAQFEFTHHDVVDRLVHIYRALPNATLVINHAGFMEADQPWQYAVKSLAELDNCMIKFSGHELLKAPMCLKEQLRVLLDAFGEDRVMLASNHPVCLIERSFVQQWRYYYDLVMHVAPNAWQKLSKGNAERVYKLEG
ncbi:amidohydrolase family protein [Pseudoalteromonas luteoviolacea]|uniref:amidohydrolase family protein n=1 Tax=Pseudoalteromonas luteoviolacea TaxID=43657 RepID=UPI0011503DBC|nr:amidohydrolase family protein [Pseudoalteromonas luteoviolacea]TQF72143.1 amidohydrolase family protein [Pseudoalteromonas luteoviolacea]